jgi:hypothetical protein
MAIRKFAFTFILLVAFMQSMGQKADITIYFETAKYEIKAPYQQGIDAFLNQLSHDPIEYRWTITGHTDSNGGTLYNDTLSDNRSTEVALFLMEKGVDSTVIFRAGKGLHEPISSNGSSTGRAKNRRVTIFVEKWQNLVFKDLGLEVPFEKFEFDVSKGYTFEFDSCTMVTIPPYAFMDSEGTHTRGKVRLEYREFRDPVDALVAGVPMSFRKNGTIHLFISGGMYELKAFKGDQELHSIPGIYIDVDFCLSDTLRPYDFYKFNHKLESWFKVGPAEDVVQEKKKPVTSASTSSDGSTTAKKTTSSGGSSTKSKSKKRRKRTIKPSRRKISISFSPRKKKKKSKPAKQKTNKEKKDEDDDEDRLVPMRVRLAEYYEYQFKRFRSYSSSLKWTCEDRMNAVLDMVTWSNTGSFMVPYLPPFNDRFDDPKYAGIIHTEMYRPPNLNEIGHISLQGTKKRIKPIGKFTLKTEMPFNDELSVFEGVRFKYIFKKEGLRKKHFTQNWHDIRLTHIKRKRFLLEIKNADETISSKVKIRRAGLKSGAKIYKAYLEKIVGKDALQASFNSQLKFDKVTPSQGQFLWWLAQRYPLDPTKKLLYYEWLEYVNANKADIRTHYSKLVALGKGICADTIPRDTCIYDTIICRDCGEKLTYSADQLILGIYNYDIIEKLYKPVTITANYIDQKGNEILPRQFYLLDKSRRGLIRQHPHKFQLSPVGNNTLVMFSYNRRRTRSYIVREAFFNSIEITDGSHVTFTVEDITKRVKNLSDLKAAIYEEH